MSEQEEGIPKGWRKVRIGTVLNGEWHLNSDGEPVFCESDNLRKKNYIIIEEIEPPKPTYIPWTFETCPLGVHVECLDARKKGMITGAGDDGARVGATVYSFEKLLSDWQLRNGTPCGTVDSE